MDLRIPCLSDHARHAPISCKNTTRALEQAKSNSNVLVHLHLPETAAQQGTRLMCCHTQLYKDKHSWSVISIRCKLRTSLGITLIAGHLASARRSHIFELTSHSQATLSSTDALTDNYENSSFLSGHWQLLAALAQEPSHTLSMSWCVAPGARPCRHWDARSHIKASLIVDWLEDAATLCSFVLCRGLPSSESRGCGRRPRSPEATADAASNCRQSLGQKHSEKQRFER